MCTHPKLPGHFHTDTALCHHKDIPVGNNVVSKTENTLGKTQLVQEGQWEGGAREVEKRRAEATYLLCLGSGKDTSAYLQRMQKAKVSPPCSPEH